MAKKTEEQKRAERLALITGNRPAGSHATNKEPAKPIEIKGVELGQIVYIRPEDLKPNPRNPYPPLEPEELEELAEDLSEKGQIVPSIAYPDKTLVCGHNRLKASLIAKERGAETVAKVPVQYVLSDLSPEAERDLMKSENDRRRGGKWTPKKKKEFIIKHFAEELEKDGRGGDRKSKNALNKIKTANGVFDPERPLSERISESSKGNISRRTAERLIPEAKKEIKKTPSRKKSISPAEKKKGEKLAKDIKKLEAEISSLAARIKNKRDKVSDLKKELRKYGEPELFEP